MFDVRLVGQETRKRVLELRNPVTVPREIGSLSRMDDNRTSIKVSQQCRDLVFGDWASVAIFVPLRIGWARSSCTTCSDVISVPFLLNIARRAASSLYSDAGLIWCARKVNRRPMCPLGPTTTSMLRNLQQRFPIGT